MSVTIVHDGSFTLIELSNEIIKLQICPERGNIFKSLHLFDKEIILLKQENYKSEERPICGCPVLFPYSGNNENNLLKINGNLYSTGIHGIVHTNRWELIEKKDYSVKLKTISTESNKKIFPFDFELVAQIGLYGNKIIYELEVLNKSSAIMPCDFGLHPFFLISHLDYIQFNGKNLDGKKLSNFEFNRSKICEDGLLCKDLEELMFYDENSKITFVFRNEIGFHNMLIWTGDKEKFLVVEPLTAYPNALNENRNLFNVNSNEKAKVQFEMEFIYE